MPILRNRISGTSKFTSEMEKMSTGEMRIAELAEKVQNEPITNLHHFVDEDLLYKSLEGMNRKSASGVDKESWSKYYEERESRIPSLLASYKSNSYKAPKVRRTYIPKEDGKQRPLGIPTIEDKVLQTAVRRILDPIYEKEFYSFSYGFQRGKSQHQALEHLFREVSFEDKRYVIDADMKDYFGSIVHGWLREFLRYRIRDKVTEQLISRWLKAGIMEEGEVMYPERGTPQGGNISPLLSNIYLHYVVDYWFEEMVKPNLKGKCSMVRFADDFVMLFEDKKDAERVMQTLPKRLGNYGLSLNPEKTRMIDLKEGNDGSKPETFDFLGFTHYMGRSRKGKPILKRKTSKKKFRQSLKEVDAWLKENRHTRLADLVFLLNQKLRGHYNYYGVTFNSRKLGSYYHQVKRKLFKWLNRRGGKRRLTWPRFAQVIEQDLPLEKPSIKHSFVS